MCHSRVEDAWGPINPLVSSVWIHPWRPQRGVQFAPNAVPGQPQHAVADGPRRIRLEGSARRMKEHFAVTCWFSRPVCSSVNLNTGRNVSTSACNGRTIMSVAEMTSDLLPIRAQNRSLKPSPKPRVHLTKPVTGEQASEQGPLQQNKNKNWEERCARCRFL